MIAFSNHYKMASSCKLFICCAVLTAVTASATRHQERLGTIVHDDDGEDHAQRAVLKSLVQTIKDLIHEMQGLKNENRIQENQLQKQNEEIVKLNQKIETIEDQMKQISPVTDTLKEIDKESEKEVLLAIGGYNSNWLSDVELYDLEQNVWRKVASLPHPRTEHSAVVLNGTVYVCGAYSKELRKTCITYDPVRDEWTTGSVAQMLEERADFGLQILNGEIYAIGGFWSPGTAEKYNPTTNSWNKIADLPINVSFFGSATVDGALYIAGGFNNGTKEAYNSLYRYDPTAEAWTQLPNMATNRSSLSMIPIRLMSENFLAVIGGHDGNESLDTLEFFSLRTGHWVAPKLEYECYSLIFKMTAARHYLGATVGHDGQTVYVAGGSSSGNDCWTTAERLKLEAEDGACAAKWSPIAPMLLERNRFSLVAVKIPKH